MAGGKSHGRSFRGRRLNDGEISQGSRTDCWRVWWARGYIGWLVLGRFPLLLSSSPRARHGTLGVVDKLFNFDLTGTVISRRVFELTSLEICRPSGWVMFMTLQSLQHFYTHVCFWSRKVLPSVDEPLEGAYEEDDAKSNDAVVYVCQLCPRILSDDTYSC
jgi:hypothetical protein